MKEKENKSFIVSADDFGKNQEINKNILELIHLDKIDRVEVFVEGKFSPLQIEKLKRSKVKLDIHLTAGDFKNERTGIFLRLTLFLTRLCGVYSPSKIELEWQNQINKFQKIFDQRPDGISSHEHVHYFPPYLKAITRLAEKNQIKFIRYGKKGTLTRTNPISFILNSLIKPTIVENLETTDYLLSLDWLKNKKQVQTIVPNGNTTELVCHFDRIEEYQTIKNL